MSQCCDKCGNRFKNVKSLVRHRQNVHLESTKRKSFTCIHCSKNFASKYNLKIHLKCVHQKSRDFVCSNCGKCFTQLISLQTHVSHVHAELNHRF